MSTVQTTIEPMKTAEYVARVLPSGHLEIPVEVQNGLQLRPNEEVKVILLRAEETAEQRAVAEAERARMRHEAVAGLLALRKEFAGMNFNLTDELVRMREEEDG